MDGTHIVWYHAKRNFKKKTEGHKYGQRSQCNYDDSHCLGGRTSDHRDYRMYSGYDRMEMLPQIEIRVFLILLGRKKLSDKTVRGLFSGYRRSCVRHVNAPRPILFQI